MLGFQRHSTGPSNVPGEISIFYSHERFYKEWFKRPFLSFEIIYIISYFSTCSVEIISFFNQVFERLIHHYCMGSIQRQSFSSSFQEACGSFPIDSLTRVFLSIILFIKGIYLYDTSQFIQFFIESLHSFLPLSIFSPAIVLSLFSPLK